MTSVLPVIFLRGETVAKKNTYLNVLAIALITGVPVSLFLGGVYKVLSPRDCAFGMLAWFVMLFLWALARKLQAKNDRASGKGLEAPLDEVTRKRFLRSIRLEKIWIGALAVCLPIGIVIGIAQHFYWQLPIAVGINLSLMYVARGRIKLLKTRLNASDRQPNSCV